MVSLWKLLSENVLNNKIIQTKRKKSLPTPKDSIRNYDFCRNYILITSDLIKILNSKIRKKLIRVSLSGLIRFSIFEIYWIILLTFRWVSELVFNLNAVGILHLEFVINNDFLQWFMIKMRLKILALDLKLKLVESLPTALGLEKNDFYWKDTNHD